MVSKELTLIALVNFLPIIVLSANNACPSFDAYPIANLKISNCYYNADVLSDVPKMAQRHGYLVKTHSVTTDDGYILNIFNIKSGNSTSTSQSVFIQHGIVTNSGPWVDIGNRSLAFFLADQGYNVWLGNVRGSTYSNKHKSLTVDNPEYWNFTLDTLAENDIPVMLKFVSDQSNNEKIVYIGHSMGTSLSFMFTSSNNNANKLLHGVISLAPVAYLDGVLVLEILKEPGLLLIDVLSLLRIKGLFYQEDFIHNTLTQLCTLLPRACQLLINVGFGPTQQFIPDDLLLYYSYWPSGTSIYQLGQYLQIAKSKRFQKYDYGFVRNQKFYGAAKPPAYNLSAIEVPYCLFYGENDSLYTAKNLERLYNELGSAQKCKYSTPTDGSPGKFDHIDFMYAKNINTALYKQLQEVVSSYFKEN